MSARDDGCAHCGAFCGESTYCSKECADADAWGTERERDEAYERDEREEAA